MTDKLDYENLREMIARCQWTFAKTMPWERLWRKQLL